MGENPTPTSDNPREGGALLGAIAREVGDLASEAHRLQDVLAGIGSGSSMSHQALVGVQALDALAQHAAELGAVLSSLAAQAPNGWQVNEGELLHRVPLAGLARRLSGDHSPAREHDHAAGEFEMF